MRIILGVDYGTTFTGAYLPTEGRAVGIRDHQANYLVLPMRRVIRCQLCYLGQNKRRRHRRVQDLAGRRPPSRRQLENTDHHRIRKREQTLCGPQPMGISGPARHGGVLVDEAAVGYVRRDGRVRRSFVARRRRQRPFSATARERRPGGLPGFPDRAVPFRGRQFADEDDARDIRLDAYGVLLDGTRYMDGQSQVGHEGGGEGGWIWVAPW